MAHEIIISLIYLPSCPDLLPAAPYWAALEEAVDMAMDTESEAEVDEDEDEDENGEVDEEDDEVDEDEDEDENGEVDKEEMGGEDEDHEPPPHIKCENHKNSEVSET